MASTLERTLEQRRRLTYRHRVRSIPDPGFSGDVGDASVDVAAALTAYAAEKIKAKGFSVVEVAPGLADAMAVKDDAELVLVKQAARLSTKAMGWTVERVEGIVNDETKVSHAKLSEECEDQILDPAKKLGLKDIEADDVDICYPPIVQSGGEYELKMSAQSSDKKLHYGVVAISLGARHTQYCTNIARTLMIDPTKPMEDVYAAVLAAQEAALGALKDGADLAAPYDAARASLRSSSVGDSALAPYASTYPDDDDERNNGRVSDASLASIARRASSSSSSPSSPSNRTHSVSVSAVAVAGLSVDASSSNADASSSPKRDNGDSSPSRGVVATHAASSSPTNGTSSSFETNGFVDRSSGVFPRRRVSLSGVTSPRPGTKSFASALSARMARRRRRTRASECDSARAGVMRDAAVGVVCVVSRRDGAL